jgi:hypothetical protein
MSDLRKALGETPDSFAIEVIERPGQRVAGRADVLRSI